MPNITGLPKNFDGGAQLTHGQLLLEFYGTDARVDGEDVRLGFKVLEIKDLTDPLTLDAGTYKFTFSTRHPSPGANGRPLFATKSFAVDLTADVSWGDIFAANISVPEMTPSLVQEAKTYRDEAEMFSGTVEGLQDDAVEALVSDDASATRAALSATYAARGNGPAALAKPYYFWHRGGGATAPEDTLEAFRAAVAQGAKFLDLDVWTLLDGSAGVMHDSTVDRTTTASGAVNDFNAAAFSQLSIDAAQWLGGGWPDGLKAPLFDAVCREFGGRVILSPEAKNTGSGALITASLQRHNVPGDMAVVQSGFLGELAAPAAAGYTCMLLSNSETPANMLAAGVTWVGVSTAVTGSYVTTCKAAGMTVIGYTVANRAQRDTLLGYGVDGLICDDPRYINDSARRYTDPYSAQMWYPGFFNAKPSVPASRGKFLGNKTWGYDDATVTSLYSCMQGWACPVSNNPNINAFNIDFTLAFDALNGGDTTRWASVFVGANTDTVFFTDNAGDGSNGYHVLLRANGAMTIYRVTNGSATQIATGTAAGITAPGVGQFKVAITPTTVAVTRKDGTPVTVTATDSTYRGGYFQFGRSGAAVRYSAVTIS